jgi:hypothetical protein
MDRSQATEDTKGRGPMSSMRRIPKPKNACIVSWGGIFAWHRCIRLGEHAIHRCHCGQEI